jgi:hypothetical protein
LPQLRPFFPSRRPERAAKLLRGLVLVRNTGAAASRQVDKPALTPAQYRDLAEVPPELEWLANITNPKTRPGL